MVPFDNFLSGKMSVFLLPIFYAFADGTSDHRERRKLTLTAHHCAMFLSSAGGKAGAAVPAAGSKEEAPAPSAATDEGEPSKLDMRVGVIVKAWEHPDSDKLFCEEIDLGEVEKTP